MHKTTNPETSGETVGQYFDQAVEIYRSSSKELTDIVREIGAGKTDRAKKLGPVLTEIRKASMAMTSGVMRGWVVFSNSATGTKTTSTQSATLSHRFQKA